MRNKSSRKQAIWISLLSALLVLSLGAYASSQSGPKPHFRKMIMLTVEFYRTQEEVEEVCLVKPPKKSNGCAFVNKKGTARIVMLPPRDWCDWSRMRTLSHELMHGLGWNHSKDYYVDDKEGPVWVVPDCEVKP